MGTLCSEYLTFAEPNAYAFGGWLGGGYPPWKNSLSRAYSVLTNLAACHISAYRLIHSCRETMGCSGTRVSVSLRAHDFVPRSGNRLTQSAAALVHRSFWEAPFRAFYCGRSALRDALPCRTESAEPTLGSLLPFLSALRTRLSLPLSITLRGVEDEGRTAYLAKALRLLRGSALPVWYCFYQGSTDGFEWLLGQSARHGVVRVDPETQERTLKSDLSQFLP